MAQAGGGSLPLGQAAEAGELVAEDMMEYGDLDKKFQQSTFGAHFVEVGVGAALANAIYNATGARVRDYPITLDKLLPGLPLLY